MAEEAGTTATAHAMSELAVFYDPERDVLTVEGEKYSGELFREMAQTQKGFVSGPFSLTRGVDGAITFITYPGLVPEPGLKV